MWWNRHSTDNFVLDFFRVRFVTNEASESSIFGAIWRPWIFWTWWQRKRPRMADEPQNRSIAEEFSKEWKANFQTPWWVDGMYLYGKVLFTCCALRLFMEWMPNQRSFLWPFDLGLHDSLIQSGEQKTSCGADGPLYLCGKRRENIISLVLDTFIGDMLGNTHP